MSRNLEEAKGEPANFPLDTFECTDTDCGLWSHYVPPLGDHNAPMFCPYCGNESLRWRTDTSWQLVEQPFRCSSCYRPESTCSKDPCAAVLRDRKT